MAFDTNPTGTTTTAAQAFALKRGVCQDLSHIFIAAARSLGVPARYIGGHFHRGDGVIEQEAGHAWAEAFVPDLGWVAFDPTNGISATDAHVRVAVGLDYLGAAPVRGSRQGGGAEIDAGGGARRSRAGGRRRASCAYSITWSARVSSVGGSVRPSALAVLRLTTKMELGRELNRQIGRLAALEDLVDEARGLAIHRQLVRGIRHQASGHGKIRVRRESGQAMLERRIGETLVRKSWAGR